MFDFENQQALQFSRMARKDGLAKAEAAFKHEKTVDFEKWQWEFGDNSKAIVFKVRPNVCVIA